MKTLTITLALIAAAAGPPVQTPTGIDTSAKAVSQAAARYVATYEAELAYILADETYIQQTFNSSGRATAQRAMHGELFLTFMPLDHEWIAVHDVADVDGQPVVDREDVQTLVRQGSIRRVAQQLADRNASFNLGRVSRNFNEPTLGLLILEERRFPRLKFTTDAVRRSGDATLVTLGFAERDRPTLISGPRGEAIPSHGDMDIEAGSGVVRRTRLVLETGPISAELTTDYAFDPKLALWLPATFSEHYEVKKPALETIRCQATYTNYRRFEVTARIK